MGGGGGGGGRYAARFGGNIVVLRGGRANFVPSPKPTFHQPMEEIPEKKITVRRDESEIQSQDEPGKMQRKIIRSGEMEFEIDSFDSSVAILTKITLEERGFVATINSEKLANGKVRGTVVVRVPPDH